MPQVTYIGLKPNGTDYMAKDAGIIRWMPGKSHAVTNDKLLQRIAQHPDMFAVSESKAESGPALAQAVRQDEPPISGADPLDSMTDAQVHALAKERGIAVHHNTKGEKLRAKVREAIGA